MIPLRSALAAGLLLLVVLTGAPRPAAAHALVAALEELAHGAGLQRVIAPVYTYYWGVYQGLLERGYSIDFTMVRMKRGKLEEYERPTDLVLDDWR